MTKSHHFSTEMKSHIPCLKRAKEIFDIHDTTETSIADCQLVHEINQLHTEILEFRSLMFGKCDTTSDEKCYSGHLPYRQTSGEPLPVTHMLCSVERCLNPKKLHLEANLLSLAVTPSIPSLHPPVSLDHLLLLFSYIHPSLLLLLPSSLPRPLLFPLFSHKSDFTLYTQSSK